MNQQQYENAYKVLAEDCEIVGQFINEDTGQTCAVGKLAQVAGIDDNMLAALDEDEDSGEDDGDDEYETRYIYKLRAAIQTTFGLEEEHIDLLIRANDDLAPGWIDQTEDERLANRRARVLGQLNIIAGSELTLIR